MTMRIGTPSWQNYFLQIAAVVKTRSKDPNTQIGCVIVDSDNQIVATGYNDLPRNARNVAQRFERPTKYDYMVHAEANAIFAAARRGISLKGCTLYLSGTHFSCLGCARAIIQSGISEVYLPTPDFNNTTHQFEESYNLLIECGVKVNVYSESVSVPVWDET